MQRLQAAISKAKAANMPKDKIDAAVKRGVDNKDGRLPHWITPVDPTHPQSSY